MKINLNKDKCIGCGRCAEICPANFKLSSEGRSQVTNKHVTDCAKKAADECPTEAIHVELN